MNLFNCWTGATAIELLIKLIRFYHGLCYRAVARSTSQTLVVVQFAEARTK